MATPETKFGALVAALDKLRGGVDGVFQLCVKKDGKDAGSFYIVIKPGNYVYGQGEPPSKPGLKLTCEDDVLVQLATDELDPMQAFMGGKIKMEGDPMSAMKLQGVAGDAGKKAPKIMQDWLAQVGKSKL
eukprot:NODE_6115_length_529_cov_33.710970.p1 GENE.NODE_6115_length_529_cov_33.710970~~NODE_6115_length_529_cov_33.710970.p1  ORF type:complete len:130 (-),score=36.77 NODE_6115_length_529_cov_33.710970:61-450(-)